MSEFVPESTLRGNVKTMVLTAFQTKKFCWILQISEGFEKICQQLLTRNSVHASSCSDVKSLA